jgi:hypothetical protein
VASAIKSNMCSTVHHPADRVDSSEMRAKR